MKTILTIFLNMTIILTSLEATEQYGKASIYSTSCNGGSRTASGVRLKNDSNMVAHKTLPFGTKIKITNVSNGKTIEAIVVDRGPFVKGRILDVTRTVAKQLGFSYTQGIAKVKIEVVGKIKLK
jgi:rare lipoprotein A